MSSEVLAPGAPDCEFEAGGSVARMQVLIGERSGLADCAEPLIETQLKNELVDM